MGRSLEAAKAALQDISGEMSPEYQKYINGELTGAFMSHLTPRVPGIFRSLTWLAEELSPPKHSKAKGEKLLQVITTRQEVVRSRLEAGELSVQAIIGDQALKFFGAHAKDQAACLLQAAEIPGAQLYMVPQETFEASLRIATAPITASIYINNAEQQPHAVYIEYPYTRGDEDHETWLTDKASIRRHQETAAVLFRYAFRKAQMLDTLHAVVKGE